LFTIYFFVYHNLNSPHSCTQIVQDLLRLLKRSLNEWHTLVVGSEVQLQNHK
jgi:hypothetical protein